MLDSFIGDPNVESELMKIIVEVCILAGVVVAFVRPKVLVYFLIFSLLESSRHFSLADYTILGSVNIKYCEITMALIYLGALVNHVRPVWSCIKVSLVVFLVMAAYSLTSGAVFYHYGQAAFNQFRPFVGMGMFIAIPLLYRTPEEARPLLRFFLIITCLMGTIELLEVLKVSPFSAWVQSERRVKTISFLGGTPGALLAMPFLYLMSTWRLIEGRRAGAFVAMVWCFALAVLSASRGVWLGLICGGVGLLWFMPLRRKLSLVWTGALMILLLTVFLKSYYIERYDMPMYERFRSIVDPQEGTARWRLDAWRAMIEDIRVHPLAGWPFGSESSFYVHSAGYYEFQAPHNDYLKIARYTGLIGLGAFLWFLFDIVAPACRRLHRDQYTRQYFELVGLLLCFLFHAVVSMVTQEFTTQDISPIIWGLAGLIHVYSLTNGARASAPAAAPA